MTIIWREPARWAELVALEEPTGFGAGIVLADDFDVILRRLSSTYLLEAWQAALVTLERFDLTEGPIWWTAMNSGETVHSPRLHDGYFPTDFIGWSSRTLENLWVDRRWPQVDQALRASTPRLALLANREAGTWRIPPSDTALGLCVIEAMAIADYTNWAPSLVLRDHAVQVNEEPWLQVAQAIARWNQDTLDAACAAARDAYTPVAYRMLLAGFDTYVTACELLLRLPSPPGD